MKFNRFFFTVSGLLFLAGCGKIAPIEPIPQLTHTPGPWVQVSDNYYDAGVFTVYYPRGWGVITPAAFSTPWVVFTAPDDRAVIVLALDEADTQVRPAAAAEDTPLEYDSRQVQLTDGQILYAVLVTVPNTGTSNRTTQFDRLIASINHS